MSDTIKYNRQTIRKEPYDCPTLWTFKEIDEALTKTVIPMNQIPIKRCSILPQYEPQEKK